MSTPSEVPAKLRPFVALGFDYVASKRRDNQAYGQCVFCGKPDKMHINIENGKWNCFAGHCGLKGNVYTFLQEWYNLQERLNMVTPALWNSLASNRQLPELALRATGFVWDGMKWWLPIYNPTGTLVTFRWYQLGNKLWALDGMDLGIWNAPALFDERYLDYEVWIEEGEWDGIATQEMLRREGVDGIAVGIPGCTVFKAKWAQWFRGRKIVCAYDHDIDGQKGVRRVHALTKTDIISYHWIKWPDQIPSGYDMRQFYIDSGTITIARTFAEKLDTVDADTTDSVGDPIVSTASLPMLSTGTRPTYESVLSVFAKYLYLTTDLEDALKILLATCISVQLEGDPLWIHLAGPPGSGKTELLLSVSNSPWAHFESSVSSHQLVSGWASKEDPSLLPRLDNRNLIIKDLTELLKGAKSEKESVFSILRGAYDGSVNRGFGHGVQRRYDVHFNIVTGVTQAIFADVGSVLGERFLIYHLVKGVGFNADNEIYAALTNSPQGNTMRADLGKAASDFLNYQIDPSDTPELSDTWIRRLVHLSQFVSMLRAGVERDAARDRLTYRAQHEMGTRIAKQLKKLLQGLSLLRYPAEITENAYKLLVRVALDSCIGFNLDIVTELFNREGRTFPELSEACRIPMTTLRGACEDMEQLGVLRREKVANVAGRGAPMALWSLTDSIKRHWYGAGLDRDPAIRQTASLQKDAFIAARTKSAGNSKYDVVGIV
jgi:hypothetical protein